MSELADRTGTAGSAIYPDHLYLSIELIADDTEGGARTISDFLEANGRFQKRSRRAEIVDFQVTDSDRRSEILHRIRDITSMEDEEWMKPGHGTVEVDWEKLKQEETGERNNIENLQGKYDTPGGLMKLTVEKPADMPFQPGDAFSIKLPATPDLDTEGYDIPEICDPEPATKSNVYSVGSSPETENLEFYILRIPDKVAREESMTPVMEAKMSELDEVILRGPENDELEMLEGSDRDIVYVSTSTGIAPHKSMLEAMVENNFDVYEGEQRDIFVFSAAKFRDELPAHNYMQEVAEENENIHYIPILSREESLSEWNGETGHAQDVVPKYIDRNLLNPEYDIHARIDPDNAEVYGCGNGLMIQSLDKMIREEGFDEQFYQTEAFF